MKFKVGTKVFQVSEDYKDSMIMEGEVVNHNLLKNEYSVNVITPCGIDYIATVKLSVSKQYLKGKDARYFTTEDDAIMYHNSLVEDYIEEIRDKYTIRKDK